MIKVNYIRMLLMREICYHPSCVKVIIYLYPRDKMANHEDDGSLAQELWNTIHPFAYRGIVPYIGKNTGVKPKTLHNMSCMKNIG